MIPSCWSNCCASTKLSENKTILHAPKGERWDSSPWSIASGTKIQKNHSAPGKLCDFLVVFSGDDGKQTGIAVELKSRVQHVSAIIEQLQNGLTALSQPARYSYVAVLVHSGRLGSQEQKKGSSQMRV